MRVVASRSRRILYLPIAAVLLLSSLSHAQEPRHAVVAQALYEQASAEIKAKNYAAACPKLEEVARLVPEGVGARLKLAQCYEGLGKLASAWSQYALARPLAVKAGQRERAQYALERITALRPRLATLTIDVPTELRSLDGLMITRDNIEVGEVQWGVSLPIDAGGHEIVASATGYETRMHQVNIVADGVAVTVEIPPLKPLVRVRPKPESVQPILVVPPPDLSWQRPLGLSIMAIGGVGLGAGLIFGALTIAKTAESNQDNYCEVLYHCDERGASLRAQAASFGNATAISLVLGTALVAGGLVLFSTAPAKAASPKTTQKPHTQLAVTPRGVRLEYRW